MPSKRKSPANTSDSEPEQAQAQTKRVRTISARGAESQSQRKPSKRGTHTTKTKKPTNTKKISAGRKPATVMSEEEDEEMFEAAGVDEVVEVDIAGKEKSRRSVKQKTATGKSHHCDNDNDDNDNDLPNLEDVDSDDEGEEVEDKHESEIEVVDPEISQEEADAKELAGLKAKWRSPVYAFFDPNPEIEYRSGRKCVIFKCSGKNCAKRELVRYLDTQDASSTSNMRKHVKACWGAEILAQVDEAKDVDEGRKVTGTFKRSGSIYVAFEKSGKRKVTYSYQQHTKTETRAEMTRWVAESMRPFNIVQDRGFQCLMKTGRPHYYIPHPTTIARDVKEVFAKTRKRVAKMLQNTESDINCGIDTWTSPNHKAFAAVTVHFEHEGKLLSMLLDFFEIAESHSGENLARAFGDMLVEFGIEHKLLSVTCDNASNNDTMITSLAERIETFAGAPSRTRCFGHIINLVAKSLLKPFDVSKAKAKEAADEIGDAMDVEVENIVDELAKLAEGIEEEDLQVQNENDGDVDNSEDLVNELELMEEEEREELEGFIQPIRLRKVSYKIIHSSTLLLPAWKDLLATLPDLAEKIMPHDVSTRWNSTYDMTEFAGEYREAYDKMTAKRENGLRDYELSEDEWKIVCQLTKVLKILKDATEFFSRDDCPNLATVIPAMDEIDTRFTQFTLDNTLDPAIRAAVAVAKKTLNRYYDKTDHSEVYRIAMIFHPRHKLSYFKQAGWHENWIKSAEEICRAEFERKYKGRFEAEVKEVTEKATGQESKNHFDNLPALADPSTAELRDELDRYLSTDPKAVKDVIQWWHNHSDDYPCLSCMARDYLSIPATSVAVERAFSRSRILISHIRNRLSAQTTRSLMCLGCWSKLGLVKDEDVLKTASLPEIDPELGDEDGDYEMPDGWDRI
ncbi:hypothetical protein D9758_006880 [Tetrapyrgos nigripes]|uniref:HAT C-terminal dimerisation domain-containing protein n=1 Tax=Tetrapyrgos nigripes TaxID=182062 RepID=A0A8H5LUR3_9AGAR|nr:hypothetical protein D9758_006880 [Tetrapyrgos nigripes]